MENLTVVAKLCNYSKVVVVPLRNIFKLNFAKSLNNRINRNQVHVMFWSKNFTTVPNFNLPLSRRFDGNSDGCFNVRLLKVFG